MAKQDPPKTKVEIDVESLSKMSAEELQGQLAKFKEVLSSDTFKDKVDVHEALGLEKPVGAPKEDINKDKINELLPKYEQMRADLTEAGYKFEESKMSEAEKRAQERITKFAEAKFAEQKQDILKADKDFPVDLLEKADVDIDGKIALATAAKELVSRNSESIDKLKKELDNANSQLKEAKMMAPKPEAKDETGASKVKSVAAKFGVKYEGKPDPDSDNKNE